MAKVQRPAAALLTRGMMFKRVCAAAVCLALVLISTQSVSVEGLPIIGPDFNTCTPVKPKVVIDHEEYVYCCMIDNGKPIKDFKFNLDLPVRVRRPAHKLDEEFIRKYERAMELMRALPPEDPRSHRAQANIHGSYCGDTYKELNATHVTLDVHHSWLFLPFHRWYLYFHERILASLIGDDTFAIPFWAWDVQFEDNPPANVMPAPYVRKNSSLYDQYRCQSHQPPSRADLDRFSKGPKADDVLVEDNLHIMWGMMIGDVKTAEAFYGGEKSLGDRRSVGDAVFEATAHHAVHGWVGDPNFHYVDMAPTWSAPREPMFYAHHSQMDRLWAMWKDWGGRDLDHPDFLNAEFVFYDENGDRVRVNVRDSLNLDNFRVTYEQVDPEWVDYKPRSIRDIDPKYTRAGILRRFLRRVLAGKTNIASALQSYFQPDKSGAKVSFGGLKRVVVTSRLSIPEVTSNGIDASSVYDEVLVIAGDVEKPFDVDVRFHIFLELPEADENTPRSCVEYLGAVAIDGSTNPMHPTVVKFKRTTGIGERLQILNTVRQKSVTITFVPAWDQKHDSDVSVRVMDLTVERKLAR